jgi:hypothetical protein
MEMHRSNRYGQQRLPRRRFLTWWGMAVPVAATLSVNGSAQRSSDPRSGSGPSAPGPGETYETHAKGMRIVPGQWRPHYPFEQIVWVSPSWAGQDYIWLDFPEAIFCGKGLLYLSHVNPAFPVLFPNLPKVPWRQVSGGVAFERRLPDGVAFGGSVKKRTESVVDLELHIRNGSNEPLTDITLQTCAYLRGIKEFSDFTTDNKFVHLPASGWAPLAEALSAREQPGLHRVGWRTKGKPVADLPVMVTLSNQADRLVAMTWHQDTLSLISNPKHPCMHADPQFRDLEPGEETSVRGNIIFFEGRLQDFDYLQ